VNWLSKLEMKNWYWISRRYQAVLPHSKWPNWFQTLIKDFAKEFSTESKWNKLVSVRSSSLEELVLVEENCAVPLGWRTLANTQQHVTNSCHWIHKN
jgi:hypothetical protein